MNQKNTKPFQNYFIIFNNCFNTYMYMNLNRLSMNNISNINIQHFHIFSMSYKSIRIWFILDLLTDWNSKLWGEVNSSSQRESVNIILGQGQLCSGCIIQCPSLKCVLQGEQGSITVQYSFINTCPCVQNY